MKSVILLIFLIISIETVAQKLPSAYHYSANGERLIRGGNSATGLYDLSKIKRVELTFKQQNYWQLLTDNYESETPITATLIYDGNSIGEIGVRFRGHSSYFTIRNSKKKSFKLDIDFVIDSLRLEGYKKLKLNNSHGDPSFMREVLYCNLASDFIPGAKANFIRLAINGEDWGLYSNVQQLDKRFLSEWFESNDGALFRAWKDSNAGNTTDWKGKIALNYMGSDTTKYQKIYTLKSSDLDDPWQQLVHSSYKLSKVTETNYRGIEQDLDIDGILWMLAIENIFTDADSYVNKGAMDYLVYFDAEETRLHPIEYDGNTTFQLEHATRFSWEPFRNERNSDYPLSYKLLQIPEYRQRYLAHYRTILYECLTDEKIYPIISNIEAQIEKFVVDDNKKLYSDEEFKTSVQEIRDFVTQRKRFLETNNEIRQKAPQINNVSLVPNFPELNSEPLSAEVIIVNAEVDSIVKAKGVNLYYSENLTGCFSKIKMFDDGLHCDGLNGDGVYGVKLPDFEEGTMVRYYVEAIADTKSQSVTYSPSKAENDVYVFVVKGSSE